MMRLIFIFACTSMLFIQLHAQDEALITVLSEIRENNPELLSMRKSIEKEVLNMKAENNAPGPSLGAYYLPFGVHNTSNYFEWEISQTLEFPTVYGKRNQWHSERAKQLELEYLTVEREVLMEAVSRCLKIVHLKKNLEIQYRWLEMEEQLYREMEIQYEEGQVGILDLNKAKLKWLRARFSDDESESKIRREKLALKRLNGNIEVPEIPSEYPDELSLENPDSLWQVISRKNPELRAAENRSSVSRLGMNLAKHEGLPDISVGFNYQGVEDSYYYGVYAGLNIPLWSNRANVKAAEAQWGVQKIRSSGTYISASLEFREQYEEYAALYNKYIEYRSTLSEINSDKLLKEAYDLGQITLSEFLNELEFYKDARLELLNMELDLHILKQEMTFYQ